MDAKQNLTQKEILVLYLRKQDSWVREYELYQMETEFGWIAPSAPRRVRELVKKGILEKRMRGKFAEVRFKRPRITLPPAYKPVPPKTPMTAQLL